MATRYLWFSEGIGVSDLFLTYTECVNDACSQDSHSEISFYSIDTDIHPNGDFDFDDCSYIGFIE